jgi:hypothetical protein
MLNLIIWYLEHITKKKKKSKYELHAGRRHGPLPQVDAKSGGDDGKSTARGSLPYSAGGITGNHKLCDCVH